MSISLSSLLRLFSCILLLSLYIPVRNHVPRMIPFTPGPSPSFAISPLSKPFQPFLSLHSWIPHLFHQSSTTLIFFLSVNHFWKYLWKYSNQYWLRAKQELVESKAFRKFKLPLQTSRLLTNCSSKLVCRNIKSVRIRRRNFLFTFLNVFFLPWRYRYYKIADTDLPQVFQRKSSAFNCITVQNFQRKSLAQGVVLWPFQVYHHS